MEITIFSFDEVVAGQFVVKKMDSDDRLRCFLEDLFVSRKICIVASHGIGFTC